MVGVWGFRVAKPWFALTKSELDLFGIYRVQRLGLCVYIYIYKFTYNVNIQGIMEL